MRTKQVNTTETEAEQAAARLLVEFPPSFDGPPSQAECSRVANDGNTELQRLAKGNSEYRRQVAYRESKGMPSENWTPRDSDVIPDEKAKTASAAVRERMAAFKYSESARRNWAAKLCAATPQIQRTLTGLYAVIEDLKKYRERGALSRDESDRLDRAEVTAVDLRNLHSKAALAGGVMLHTLPGRLETHRGELEKLSSAVGKLSAPAGRIGVHLRQLQQVVSDDLKAINSHVATDDWDTLSAFEKEVCHAKV